ncbi:MAG TPA: aminotransferase class IV, partial [Mariprofundaceae bacterium]|nr:aminotransferase class IV [Mariprofundaceae bacterium]
MELTAWVNGRFLPLAQATVHIEDRGFQFADSVYEVIACLGGVFVDLEAHLDRLARSCEAISLPLPMPLTELDALVREAYARNPFTDATIYIQITRGVAPRSHVVPANPSPTLVVTVRQLVPPPRDELVNGADVISLPDIRWQRCDIKSTALLGTVLGRLEVQRRGIDEAFWLDTHGHVLEGCSTNVFALIAGRLVTHPLDHHVLGGITRDMAIRLAGEHGIAIEERPWKLDEPELSECMMTSTTTAVIPVTHVDGRAIGDGRPGDFTLALRGWMLDEFDTMR